MPVVDTNERVLPPPLPVSAPTLQVDSPDNEENLNHLNHPPSHIISSSNTGTTSTTTTTAPTTAATKETVVNTSSSSTTPPKIDPSVQQLQQRIAQRRETTTRRRRSSSTHSQQDPIIAPGFGTRRDLVRLARELSLATSTTSTFTVETIQYLMERRGRGIPKKTDGSSSHNDATTTAATSTAWDDFMKEAGISGSTTALEDTTTTAVGVVTGKRGRSSMSATTGATTTTSSSSTTTTSSSQQQRIYDLESLQLPSLPKTKGSSNKKSKVDVNAIDDDSNGGLLLQTGTMDATLIGRKNDTKKVDWEAPYTLSVPTILPLLPKVRITKVIAAGHACHTLAISTTGTVYGWGRNEQSQLGSSLGSNVYQPTPLVPPDDAGPICNAAVGKGHTVLLSYSGQIMACGSNKTGQCGINHSGTEIVSNFRNCVASGTSSVPKMVAVACGEDFSIVLDTDGYMYSAGSSEYGQLGNGETGEYFVCANKLAFANSQSFMKRTTFCHAPNEKIYGNSDSNTKIVPISEDIRIQQIACGKHHCIALEANTMSNTEHQQPRIFTWGCGDYGVLGHGIQADEYYPRNVGSLTNLRYMTTVTSASEIRIVAGQHCSLLQTSNGHVYYWGKHRSVGEATMRPTLVDALANNGHVVSEIGAGGQTVVCCTKHGQTVAWGQGTYGELGFGLEKKSSSKPSFVPGLEGCQITSLACGYGTTIFVVRDNDKKVMDQLPRLDITVLEALAAEAAESAVIAMDDEEDEDKPKKGRKGRPKK